MILVRTPPIITLIGDALIKTEAKIPYNDPGATAIDNYDGDISNNIDISNNVNTELIGTYNVTYNVTDSNGNPATQVTRIVIVEDTTPPVITLIGASNETIEVHTPYVDPGAYAVDTYDGDISNNMTIVNTLDYTTLGTYTIKYSVRDSTGNRAESLFRTINVVDTTPPVITLNDASFITLEVFDPYIEYGATAIDNYDGDISNNIDISSNVNINLLGTYYVKYNVSDACGNKATEVIRTINVVDTTPPVITLNGPVITLNDASFITLEVFDPYIEYGATAIDNYDGDISNNIDISGNVNINVLGTYYVKYNVSDACGNKGDEVIRTVNIVDTTPPVMTLNDASFIILEAGIDPYIEYGATAIDNYDGDISNNIDISSNVDISKTGTYYTHYNVSDACGNKATELIRTIVVADTIPPIITLNDASNITLEGGIEPYIEYGANAIDIFDGDISNNIDISGNVDITKVGTYYISYNVSDAEGNQATEVIRTINVVDTTPPVMTMIDSSNITLEVFDPYIEYGVTAIDIIDGDISHNVDISGSVDISFVDTYTIKYNVSDACGNKATELIRTVNVVDTTPPVITLIDASYLIVEAATYFNDPGAFCI